MGAAMIVRGPKGRRFDLSEGAGLSWFWALGEDTWNYHGVEVNLTGDRFDRVAESLAESIAVWSPPVHRDHKIDGDPLGLVRRTRVLTLDEAEALGIPQKHARALYVGVELNHAGRALDAGGALLYGSVGLDFNWADEHGRTWFARLREYSVTSIPHLKRGNVERPALSGVTLAEATTMDEQILAALQTIADGMARIEARLTALESTPAEMAPEPVEADGETVEAETVEAEAETVEAMDGTTDDEAEAVSIAASELAARDKRIAALERSIRRRDARDEVAQIVKGKAIANNKIGDLVELRLSDARAFGILVDNLPDRPDETPRTAGTNAPAPSTVHDLALSIMASETAAGRSITYETAATRAAMQIRG